MTPKAILAAEATLVFGGVALFLFATMAVFAGRCATVGPAKDGPDLSQASLVPRWVRAWWGWLCSPVVRACRRLGIPAEVVALLGVIAAGLSAVAVVSHSLGFGGWTFLVAATLLGIGGQLARREGRPVRAAALLDGTLGRLSELLVLGALAYAVRNHGAALVAALCAMGATMLASDARLRSESMGAPLPSNAAWFGRGERALLVGVPCAFVPAADVLFHRGAGLDVVAAALGILTALGVVSAVRRIHSGHEALRTIDALSATPLEASRRLRVVRGGRP